MSLVAFALLTVAYSAVLVQAGKSCSVDGSAYQGGGHRRRRRWQSCPVHTTCHSYPEGCQCDFGYVCQSSCDQAVGRQCISCTDMELSGVVTSDTVLSIESGTILLKAVVNNTSGGTTAMFEGTFYQADATYDTVSHLATQGHSETFSGKVTWKEPWIVKYITGQTVDAEFSGSYTVTGSYTIGTSKQTYVSTEVESQCGVEVPPDNCVTVSTSVAKGTVNANFTAIATCPALSTTTPASAYSVASSFQVTNVYAQATYTSCIIEDCVTGAALSDTELLRRNIRWLTGRRLGQASAGTVQTLV